MMGEAHAAATRSTLALVEMQAGREIASAAKSAGLAVMVSYFRRLPPEQLNSPEAAEAMTALGVHVGAVFAPPQPPPPPPGIKFERKVR